MALFWNEKDLGKETEPIDLHDKTVNTCGDGRNTTEVTKCSERKKIWKMDGGRSGNPWKQ